MSESFSTLDITKLLNIPRERLRSWMNEGYVKPSTEAYGRGTRAGFTRQDLYMVAIFEDIIGRGIKRVVAAGLVKQIQKADRQLKQDYVVVRYCENNEIEINSFTSKAMGIDLETGGVYRPVNQNEAFYRKDEDGHDIPFMPFRQRTQVSVFNPASFWSAAMILNIGALKKRVDDAIARLKLPGRHP